MLLRYMQLPGHSKNLVRILSRKESAKNKAKLEYELEKLEVRSTKSEVAPATVIRESPKPLSPEQQLEDTREEAAEQFHGSVRLQDLHPSLHERFILQKQTFYKIWKLHYQLEEIRSDGERLKSMIEIMQGWELINAIWKELDYYLQHGQLLPSPTDNELDNLNDAQLAQRKRTVHSNISKYQKKVNQLKEQLDAEQDPDTKKKLEKRLIQATGTLGRNEVRLAEINKKINE